MIIGGIQMSCDICRLQDQRRHSWLTGSFSASTQYKSSPPRQNTHATGWPPATDRMDPQPRDPSSLAAVIAPLADGETTSSLWDSDDDEYEKFIQKMNPPRC
ncbi:hypothetical protein PR202_gb20200 [Eleusine coracana subsp. coracana]|uniref:Uncharacterized protein n=1 Tax=Eleusine coracana subsp. coracana TaxID=191504 RepID=A0AAV5FAR9_ELECO|nr:hypothetical protein PR202_gb20200 [Eleusine coracana subsp. coracana]